MRAIWGRQAAAVAALLTLTVACGGKEDDAKESVPQGIERTRPSDKATASPTPAALTAHDPPTRFVSTGSLPLGKAGVDAVALDGRRAYTYASDSGAVVALDLATGHQVGEGARPQGDLPDRYGEPGAEGEGPLCERRAPALGTAGGKRIALGVFPTVTKGAGTTADTSTYELVALDTRTGTAAWQAPLGITVGGDFCHVAGISGNVAVVVLGGSLAPPNTYGIDLKSRKKLWTQQDFEAQLVQGSHVLGVDSSGDGTRAVASLDSGSGNKQWRALEAARSAEFAATPFSTQSVFVLDRSYHGSAAVLRLSDGKELDAPGIGEDLHEVQRCVYDQRSLTFCFFHTTVGGELAAYEAAGRKRLWQLGGADGAPGRVAPELVTAFHGAVYASLSRDGGASEPVVLDGTTGADRELAPGATPKLVNAYAGLGGENQDTLYRTAK
ncbi:outer membrane protein assembly factor BamB family protein [Streptomyces sp. NPDC001020]